MKLTYLGHSAFRFETAGSDLLADPFLSGNPAASSGPDAFDPDFIIVTHAHADHVGDAAAIARRSGATILAAVEVCNHLEEDGVRVDGMNVGGPVSFPFGTLEFTQAWHSSSFGDGTYGGLAMGFVLEADGQRIYHAGDTALFSDMSLIAAGGLDVALLPIGSRYTMDPAAALEAVKLLKPKRVIPIHYNTFAAIRQDGPAFRAAVERETDSECVLLEPGQSLDLQAVAARVD
jgi:L-ascorbate metabolism protein UlaG (beta-lactamase superfamily)